MRLSLFLLQRQGLASGAQFLGHGFSFPSFWLRRVFVALGADGGIPSSEVSWFDLAGISHEGKDGGLIGSHKVDLEVCGDVLL